MACAITSPAPRCSDTLSLLHPRNLPGVRDAATLFTTERKAACCDGAAPLWLINSPSALLGALQFEGVTCGVSAGSSSAGHFDFLGAFASGQVLPTGWWQRGSHARSGAGRREGVVDASGRGELPTAATFILPPAPARKARQAQHFPCAGNRTNNRAAVCLSITPIKQVNAAGPAVVLQLGKGGRHRAQTGREKGGWCRQKQGVGGV